MTDIASLKALAEEATPGPWRATYDGHGGMRIESIEWQIGYCSRAGGKQEANAALIAACDRETILRLCEVVEKAKAVMDKYSPDSDFDSDELELRSALGSLEDGRTAG